MVTYTTTYSLAKPSVAGDEDVWGGYLNGNFDTLENLLKGTTALTAINVTGNITVGGTVDGVDIAARDAVLTSTTTTANAALPKAGGTMTGAITFAAGQTFDGRDVSADGAKLDGIEAGATADQTKADIDALGIAASTAATLATARNIALTGAVTGNVNFDGSGNVSIATTATSDPTLTLAGDASGSATFTNLGNATLTVTVADDSHNHVISNVDGLQTALDGKVDERNRTNWNTSTSVIDDVIGQLGWKHYGNNHTIFDASNSTSPDGTSVNNTNAAVAWSATYPTLMGWNGSSTYGVRVDSARVSDNISSYTINQSVGTGNSPTFADVYANNWFRNNQSGEGLYNTATTQHWYSDDDDWWNVAGGTVANGIRFRDEYAGTVRGAVYADNTNAVGFLDSDNQWAIKHTRDSRTEFMINNVEYMELNSQGLFLHDGSLKEDWDALSGTTPTCNPDSGGAFSLTMTGNTTFTFTGADSGYSCGFILQLTGNGGTVTWPASVDWAGGTAPDAPASGETDIYVFWTRDGGTTWYGVQSIDAAA